MTRERQTLRVLVGIKETLTGLGGRLEEQTEAMISLEEAIEMNLWVLTKVLGGGDAEELERRVRESQQEYLAVTAIFNFFQAMAQAYNERGGTQ